MNQPNQLSNDPPAPSLDRPAPSSQSDNQLHDDNDQRTKTLPGSDPDAGSQLLSQDQMAHPSLPALAPATEVTAGSEISLELSEAKDETPQSDPSVLLGTQPGSSSDRAVEVTAGSEISLELSETKDETSQLELSQVDRAETAQLAEVLPPLPAPSPPLVGIRASSIPRRPLSVSSTLVSTMYNWTDRMKIVHKMRQQMAQTQRGPFEEQPDRVPAEQPVLPAQAESIEPEPVPSLSTMRPIKAGNLQIIACQKMPLSYSHLPRTAVSIKHSRIRHRIWLTRQRREQLEMRSKQKKRLGTILGLFSVALIVSLISSGTGYVYAYYQSQQPRLQSVASAQIDQSTHIYDRNGTLLYTLYDPVHGRGTPVSYQFIPGVMQDAMIAAEDPSFWTNPGIDPQGILRALDQYISDHGQVESGGSTLTQQLIKDLTNDNQLTFQRKLSEASLAIGLTQEYPKWKILEMYFDTAPFGAQDQGVEAAAEDFFGLTPKCDKNFNCIPALAFLDRNLKKCKVTRPRLDESSCAESPLLGLARASFLAGMPQNPVIFDPTADPAHIPLALQRQDYVLQQMLADKMSINLGLGSQSKNIETITPAIIRQVEVLTKNIKFVGFKSGTLAPHFIAWVIQNLADQLGNNRDIVNGISVPGLHILNTAGLNIRTTLDLNLEKYVESAINRHLKDSEYQPFVGINEILSKDDNLHDSAVVVMDAKNGEVLAMDGSANFKDTSKAGSGQINMALQPRQPGSAFKPIALAAAYQMGFYPGMVLPDKKTYFPKGKPQYLPANSSTYAPPDYGGGYHNINSNIELAIANSFNIPALKIAYFAGLQNVYNMAARLGITTINPKTGLVPSMGLGTDAVSLLQMVDAYQTFADQGIHVSPQGILDVWDNYGHHLYHYDTKRPSGVRVLSPQVAYLLTSTLDNNAARSIEFGGDPVLTMDNWTLANGQTPQVAAKTGTTDSFRDNWTIGYTPDLVVGTWSGNADDEQMVNSIGVTGAAPVWNSVIYYASGYCNQANDQIPCPTYDLHYKDHFFPIPDGIVQQEVNTSNGLAGFGYDSAMINGEQPAQDGNLLKNANPFAPR